jgi:hypothetical protein
MRNWEFFEEEKPALSEKKALGKALRKTQFSLKNIEKKRKLGTS